MYYMYNEIQLYTGNDCIILKLTGSKNGRFWPHSWKSRIGASYRPKPDLIVHSQQSHDIGHTSTVHELGYP